MDHNQLWKMLDRTRVDSGGERTAVLFGYEELFKVMLEVYDLGKQDGRDEYERWKDVKAEDFSGGV